MSCLRLRFPPARRAWKRFTSKLQSKLHKPKGITKPRNRVKAITAASSSSASASVPFQPYKFLRLRFKRRGRLALGFRYKRSQILRSRSTAHVYVDKLFIEPVAVTQQAPGPSQPPVAKCKQPATLATADGDEKAEAAPAGDDMWESMGIASPLMHGIDDRAEEFIARFRKEMEDQEKLARNHL